jgi:DNA-binding Lrp family transcriptional regulator
MDRLDIRIVRELMQAHTLWPARPGLISSYRYIARQLGVSPGTVRNRIREMLRTGFLQGTIVFANPSLLGLLSGSYAIEVPSDHPKAEVVDRLGRIERVVFFEDFRGPLLGIGLVYEDERTLERLLARIRRVSGAAHGMFSRVEQPPSAASLLSAPEWELVVRLMQGPFRTYSQLARELRTSVRTLKRRLAKLVRAGAVLTFPRLDYRALSGGVTVGMLVDFAEPPARAAAEARTLHLVEDRMTYLGAWESFQFYRLILPNVALATDLARDVERIPGVRSVRVELVNALVYRLDVLRPFAERRAAALAARKEPPVVAVVRARRRAAAS